MNGVTVIVPAAGSGERMNRSVPKQFLPLEGKPILAHTLLHLNQFAYVDSIVLAVNKKDIEYCKENIVDRYSISKVEKIVAGGAIRQESVYRALKSIKEEEGIVAVHDGVRPFLRESIFEEVVEAGRKIGAAIVAIPSRDTLKKVDDKGHVHSTKSRDGLWLVQTPQVFHLSLLRESYEEGRKRKLEVTDDASLVEMLGRPVKVVQGSLLNIKITTPEDLLLAEAILEMGEW